MWIYVQCTQWIVLKVQTEETKLLLWQDDSKRIRWKVQKCSVIPVFSEWTLKPLSLVRSPLLCFQLCIFKFASQYKVFNWKALPVNTLKIIKVISQNETKWNKVLCYVLWLVVNENELENVYGDLWMLPLDLKNIQDHRWQLHHYSPVQCFGYNYRILVRRIGLRSGFLWLYR